MAWNQAFEATDNLENRPFDPSLFFVPGTRFGTINVSGINALGPDTQTPTFVDLKSLQLIDNVDLVARQPQRQDRLQPARAT